LIGVFVNPLINSGTPGFIYEQFSQFFAQIEGILITFVVLILRTLLCAGIVSIFTPLRVDRKEELVSLDISEHGENAYPSFTGLN
jgi:Amt family ammonium transporter